ncbi:MAG: hypothetical protein UT11_C0022G0014 [Berkelbacteria bacterium GW2011_GWA2_38_9]|uniref:Uncharacterized protein n=1 Tax=Berkelbacteria bacterium GW2011_GWA2_38_9 TaxID=1618334 RepID=A0A0G0PK02_9BACT|nr:MAG: hypothetical protein UT11_C0022G0014 [Berkelbacteria bacterium GW2011_GWA2_38_9]
MNGENGFSLVVSMLIGVGMWVYQIFQQVYRGWFKYTNRLVYWRIVRDDLVGELKSAATCQRDQLQHQLDQAQRNLTDQEESLIKQRTLDFRAYTVRIDTCGHTDIGYDPQKCDTCIACFSLDEMEQRLQTLMPERDVHLALTEAALKLEMTVVFL